MAEDHIKPESKFNAAPYLAPQGTDLEQDILLVPGRDSTTEEKILYCKRMRVHYANHLHALKQYRDVLGRGEAGRHASIAITELENVRFRLGMVLQELGLDNPYPNGNDPTTAKVDPPTDVAK